jgi:hypothetical protein
MVRKLSSLLSIVAIYAFASYGATVRGFVEDNATPANAIAGAVVTLAAIGGGGTALTDTTGADGSFSFTNITATGIYRATVVKAGYTQNATTGIVNVASATGTYSVNIIMTPRAAGSTVSGAITDSVSAATIAGARVLLQQTTGIRIVTVDSAVSAANGTYLFDSVAAGTYQIAVSAVDYISKTVTGVTVTAAVASQTVNIKLRAVATGKLTGKISADSLRGPAIAGATVILEEVPNVGGANIPIDTVTTDANGMYLFPKVAAASNYQVTASKVGFTQKTAQHRNQTAGTDTVNMFLASIATGDIYVVVLKRSDSSAIAGASVTVTPNAGGAALLGMTGATGIAAFLTEPTGRYAVAVTAAGFNPGNANTVLQQNAKDSVKIYLVAAANGTKVLTGTVTDSVAKTALANVKVTLTIGGGVGGAQYVFVDSTDAAGKFMITGIPTTAFTGGTIAAVCTGYRNKTITQVTLGQNGRADTTTFNFVMSKLPVGVVQMTNGNAIAKPEFTVSGSMLSLRNFNENGVVSIFSANGKLLYRADLPAHTSSLALPRSIIRGGNAYVVAASQNSAVYRKLVVMP